MFTSELILIGLSAVWCAMAVFYSGPPLAIDRHVQRRATSLIFVVIALAALELLSLPAATLLAVLMFAAVLTWFVRQRARDLGGWETEYQRVPRVAIEGSSVRVSDVRNFRYRTVEDVVPAYYDAVYNLDSLTRVDLICSYWSGRHIAHVFLSFGFADGRHLAVSVETRRRRDQAYSVIAGFFRHYQLIFVVADERDLIGVRTDVRREDVYLYRLRTTPEERRQLFLGYMARVDQLSRQPEFYNTALNNCTTNIVALIDGGLPKGQRLGMDWRIVFSGHVDEFGYEIGRLKGRMPFAELKARSLIVRPPDAEIDDDYSAAIRRARAEPSGISADKLIAAAAER